MKRIPNVSSEATTVLLQQNITDYFEQQINAARHVHADYAVLWSELYRLVQAGGKRLRPHMVFLSYEAFGGRDIALVAPIAAAQEMLHQCLLIHDDIIDRDYVRHGVPNVTGGYQVRYRTLVTDPALRTHYANGAALMGGDLLLSAAYQMIAQSGVSDAHKLQVQTVLGQAIFEVGGGELLDTEASFRPAEQTDTLLIARYKSAGYSFVGPLVTGAILADATSEQRQVVHAFAENLGAAFQLQDDILGVFGSTFKTGKSTTGDIREGKRTYLVECFYAVADNRQKQLFEKYFGRSDITSAQANQVRKLLNNSGAKERTIQKIAELEVAAVRALIALELSSEYHDRFLQLVQRSLRRDH
jgi:geranylgeranyl diphosphate synthase type II